MSAEPTEQLLDVFKAAALSVTKLYKTSASVQAKARSDGYQDCLEDLIAFLDKEGIGLGEGEGRKIRKWATERFESRDASAPVVESEDEVDKAESVSSPEIHRSSSTPQLSGLRSEVQMQDPAPVTVSSVPLVVEEQPPEIVVPTQETFTFQSSHPYPQDALNFAKLDLSDSHSTNSAPISRTSRTRHASSVRTSARSATQLGRGAGQKRKINIAEIFDFGSLGYGKDPFGSGGNKRNRHA
ncbi:hypothetical protein VTK73DRAFT_1497 [Phialemonium thermophilum]|uniref:Uncharacterized protein n=1 Tax=Phialemonium thermophilum TaxID=223376 RepID=A0ABR3X9X3_9PEZI